MANATARYKNSDNEDLELLLDIDLSSQKVREVRAVGSLTTKYEPELVQLESLILGKTIAELMNLKREELTSEILINGKKALAPLSLWLLNRAVENYLGSEAVLLETNDSLCLCFGVGVHDLRKQILKRPDYELKHLIAETYATSACGSCLNSVKKTMEELHLSHGMLPGLAHSKGRFDKDGKWVKIKGLYPGPLLILLDDLKTAWMKREELGSQFKIELTHIEGLHLTLSVKTSHDEFVDADRAEKILQALSDYYKSETGILFFLHLFH